MLAHREDGQAVVSAEVHATDESSDKGEYCQTVAVGGRQGKLDAASQCNDTAGGVAATNGARCGAAAGHFTSEYDVQEEEQEFTGVGSEKSDSCSLPELVDMDPDVAFGCKYCVVRSTRNLVPLVQSKVLVKDAKVYLQELTSWSPLTESLVHRIPMKPRFVHGDGMLIWSLTRLLMRQSADKVTSPTTLVGDKCQILM